MKTEKILTVFLSCLVLAGIAGTEFSFAEGPGGASPGIGLRTHDFRMLSAHAFWPSCGCPDIAYTESFQSGGLGYVSSPEFADAVRAVANGDSEFSPAETPPEWPVAAENWIEYINLTPDEEGSLKTPNALFQLRGGEVLQFPKGKYACNPDLVHLASLEYRKMQGQKDLPTVSTRAVNAATKELQSIVAAKRQLARSLAARASAIASRIAEAERMGAGNCSPAGIARAKWELEQAFIEARTVRTSQPETVSSFDRAERYADFLLAERRFASSSGGVCQ